MALTDCPECGKKGLSDTAAACPNCGFNIGNYFSQKRLAAEKKERDAKAREEQQKRDAEKALIAQGICPKCKNKLEKVEYCVDESNHITGPHYCRHNLTYCSSCRWEEDYSYSSANGPLNGENVNRPGTKEHFIYKEDYKSTYEGDF